MRAPCATRIPTKGRFPLEPRAAGNGRSRATGVSHPGPITERLMGALHPRGARWRARSLPGHPSPACQLERESAGRSEIGGRDGRKERRP